MAYEMVMPYHLHMPSYFLETFTEYPYLKNCFLGKERKQFFFISMFAQSFIDIIILVKIVMESAHYWEG